MSDSDKKIQEMQFIEHNLQNLLSQKQAFQIEMSETDSAVEELKNSGDEVYKLIGQMMIKSDKSKISSELENKKRLIDLRLKNIEKQEEALMKKVEELRKEVLDSQKKEKKN